MTMNGASRTDTGGVEGCLFYDGACALCSAEVERLAQLSRGSLALQDIHLLQESDQLPAKHALLQTLHYRDASGDLKTGLSANVAAWQHTRFGWMWRALEWPLIRPVVARCYDAWALWRYRRLYGVADNRSEA